MCYINGNYAILLIIICSGSILNKIQIDVTLLFHYVILYYLKYSKRPKSEQFGFQTAQFCSVVKSVRYENMSEIRTISFGFQTVLVIPKTERYITERSDFGQLTKLDRFI